MTAPARATTSVGTIPPPPEPRRARESQPPPTPPPAEPIRVRKIQPPATPPNRPSTTSPIGPYPPPFITNPATQPASTPTTIHETNVPTSMTVLLLQGRARRPPPRPRDLT